MSVDILKSKMDEFARITYQVTRGFPKDEIYGLTSQSRRAALSVVLNYIEGFARGTDKELKHFLRISYGSLKESKYLIFFSFREQYLIKEEYETLMSLADEIGAMTWKRVEKLNGRALVDKE
ncbi:MAG: four helix bundle protein [Candidatus Moranbacteria bacterium]|nr:four helix bundle protein [Candidatus Moranbacteria bacterium]